MRRDKSSGKLPHGGVRSSLPDKRVDYLSIDGEAIDALPRDPPPLRSLSCALHLYPMNPVLRDSCFYEDRAANESICLTRATFERDTRIAIEIVDRIGVASFSYPREIMVSCR